MDRSVLEEKSYFKMLGLSVFFSKLGLGSYIVSIAETVSKKIEALILSTKIISPEFSLYLCKSIMWPTIKYCCHN